MPQFIFSTFILITPTHYLFSLIISFLFNVSICISLLITHIILLTFILNVYRTLLLTTSLATRLSQRILVLMDFENNIISIFKLRFVVIIVTCKIFLPYLLLEDLFIALSLSIWLIKLNANEEFAELSTSIMSYSPTKALL